MKIAIFQHATIMGNYWQEIDKEITTKIETSKLINNCDAFFHCVSSNPKDFEFPTLEKLKKFADQNTNYAILYLHTKGISYKFDKPSVAAWRRCMLYFLVEKWQDCMIKLVNNKDVLGCRFLTSPMPHFQGNFWWSTSKHIKKLRYPREIELKIGGLFEERHKAEMWICSETGIFHELYNWKVNPYSDIIPNNYKTK